MIAGHTKFSPDQHFGTIKKRFSRTFVSSLPELSEVSFQIFSLQIIQPIFNVHNKRSFFYRQVLAASAVSNRAVVVGDGRDGTAQVPHQLSKSL